MLDKFNRKINYLRISLTDKCNLSCFYCKPKNLQEKLPHKELLSIEQIEKIVKEAAALGITKVRFTGGEPLLYKGLEDLIRKIRSIEKIKEIAITTNGTFLATMANSLKAAGVDRINISLDSLDGGKYRKITGGGNILDLFDGIDAAIKNDLAVKINMVVIKGINDNEIESMREFCREKSIEIQLIKHFDLNSKKNDEKDYDRPPKCTECNRIRLLSDGMLKPCLHSELEYKLNMANIQECLAKTILNKPQNGFVCSNRKMVEIGG